MQNRVGGRSEGGMMLSQNNSGEVGSRAGSIIFCTVKLQLQCQLYSHTAYSAVQYFRHTQYVNDQ